MSTSQLDTNAVVYLAVSGQLLPARVHGHQGSRLVTVDREGVQRVIARDRVYWSGGGVARDEEALEQHWSAVREAADRCDLQMTWEFLVEASSLEAQEPTAVADLALGAAGPVETDAVALAIFRGSPYFKLRKWRVHPASAQALEAAQRAEEDKARAAEELALALRVLGARLEGQDTPLAPEDDAAVRRHLDALIQLALYGADAQGRDIARALLDGLGHGGKKAEDGRAFRLLVALGEFQTDENLFVRRAGIRRGFSERVLAEAEALVSTPSQGRPPQDLRHLFTVAIDGEGTTEVDDAFAIDGGRLYVFIADVAAYVRPGGLLDTEALSRAVTVYLPEGKIPMLPSSLSEGAASLDLGDDHLALCFSGELEDDGRLTAFEVSEAVCRVDRRLTYVEADEILEASSSDDPVAGLVLEAARWCRAHRQHRASLGALLLQRHEVDIRVGDDGRVQANPVNANGPARQLISEMMVATCSAVGAWCHDQQIPCVYRAQPSPDVSPGVEGTEITDTIEQIRVLRRLKPSCLTTRPQRHYTLGISGYTQITSPLRRYTDLVMHQQIKGFLRHQRAPFTEGDLMGIFETVDRAAGAARRASNDSRRYWVLKHLEQQPGQRWRALALRSIGRRWLVELSDLAFTATIKDGAPFQEGEQLLLEVVEVDPRRDHLQLKVVERSRP